MKINSAFIYVRVRKGECDLGRSVCRLIGGSFVAEC